MLQDFPELVCVVGVEWEVEVFVGAGEGMGEVFDLGVAVAGGVDVITIFVFATRVGVEARATDGIGSTDIGNGVDWFIDPRTC